MSEMVTVPKKEFKKMKKDISSIKETLDVLMDRELMESAKRGMKDIEEGRLISHKDNNRRHL